MEMAEATEVGAVVVEEEVDIFDICVVFSLLGNIMSIVLLRKY